MQNVAGLAAGRAIVAIAWDLQRRFRRRRSRQLVWCTDVLDRFALLLLTPGRAQSQGHAARWRSTPSAESAPEDPVRISAIVPEGAQPPARSRSIRLLFQGTGNRSDRDLRRIPVAAFRRRVESHRYRTAHDPDSGRRTETPCAAAGQARRSALPFRR